MRGPWWAWKVNSRDMMWGAITLLAGILLGAFLHGCGYTGEPLPTPGMRDGEGAATHIVWHEVYGRMDRPPKVRWIQGARLSCTDPISGKLGFPQFNDKAEAICREGLTMSPLEVMAAYHGEKSLSDTVMAHELMHALQARKFEYDPEHNGPEWKTVEECGAFTMPGCGLVDLANRRMAEAGF